MQCMKLCLRHVITCSCLAIPGALKKAFKDDLSAEAPVEKPLIAHRPPLENDRFVRSTSDDRHVHAGGHHGPQAGHGSHHGSRGHTSHGAHHHVGPSHCEILQILWRALCQYHCNTFRFSWYLAGAALSTAQTGLMGEQHRIHNAPVHHGM